MIRLWILVCSSLAMAQGFTVPRGQLYAKLETTLEDADSAFDNQGDDRPIGTDVAIDSLESTATNLYLAYGLTKRFSVSAALQHKTADLNFASGTTRNNDGLTDLWLGGRFLIAKTAGVNWVANASAKLAQQENRARAPQITNGEDAYTLGLGVGYGYGDIYLEGGLARIWNDGFVNNVRQNGIPFDDELEVTLKAGWRVSGDFVIEGVYTLSRTEADLEDENYIPGIFANSDEDRARVSASYQLARGFSLGVVAEQTLSGKNLLENEISGVQLTYVWSR